jgi:hypothetical protein
MLRLFLLLSSIFLAFSSKGQFRCQDLKASSFPLVGPSIDYNSRSDTFDILHTHLNLDIRSTSSFVAETQLRIYTKLPSSKLRLDLLNFNVDSVAISGKTLQSFTRNNPFLEINANNGFAQGDSFLVKVFYRGTPATDASGWGGWHNANAYSFNLGVGFQANPHVYGRSIFPCFDNFVEKSTFSSSVLTLSPKKGVCSGNLISETTQNGEITTSWELTDPIPSYLFAVAVSDYLKWSHTTVGLNGSIEVAVYGRSTDTANIRNSFRNIDSIFAAFEQYFGPYPWQRIGYSITTIGAMEHATSIHFPRNLVDGSLNGEDIIAHELAHHWFGNLVTCERAEDMWFNEGWAEYCSHLYEEYVYDRARYLKTVRENRDYVLRFAAIRDNGHKALSNIDQDYTYGQHIYQKGAMVAHNLREYMGDSLFFGSLRSLFAQKAFGNLSIDGFQSFLENYSSLNLDPFFDGWVHQAGYPGFEIDSIYISPNSIGNQVQLRIQQKTYAAPQWYKEVPLTLKLMDSSGNTDYVQTLSSSIGEFTSLQFTTPLTDVQSVVIDPVGLVLMAQSTEERSYTQAGTESLSNLHFNLDIQTVGSPASLAITHHWVAPDPLKLNASNFRLSPNHFWSVDGNWDSDFLSKALITFDGRISSAGLDADLLKSGEDSLLLFYRANPSDDWMVYPHYQKDMQGSNFNKVGLMRLSELLKGQYCFANGNPSISIGEISKEETDTLVLYPNPAKDKLSIELPESVRPKKLSILLYDQTGRLLSSPSFELSKSNRLLELNIASLAKGSYWIVINGWKGRFEKS